MAVRIGLVYISMSKLDICFDRRRYCVWTEEYCANKYRRWGGDGGIVMEGWGERSEFKPLSFYYE